ncbi:MAG: hypothetical protein WB384_13890, partial [Candidatus Sulfotelmatobacter sp.]
ADVDGSQRVPPLRHKLAQINSTVGSANTRMRPPQRGFVQVGLWDVVVSAVDQKRTRHSFS